MERDTWKTLRVSILLWKCQSTKVYFLIFPQIEMDTLTLSMLLKTT